MDRYLESYGVPLQLINDVSAQVEVGGACLCDSTAAPPLLDIATVAITDYYNLYVSSAFFIGRSVDIEMVTGYRHVRLPTGWCENEPDSGTHRVCVTEIDERSRYFDGVTRSRACGNCNS